MAGDAISITNKIPKPVLRGLHNASIRKNLIVSGVLMAIAGAACQYYNSGRIRDYAEFYKTYDADAAFKRIAAAGLMQSVSSDEE